MSLDVYLNWKDHEIFSANCTHNLGQMAREAGLYDYLWQPETVGVTLAAQLIRPLEQGLIRLKTEPERFKLFNSENGWGSYEGFVEFVQKYYEACIRDPECSVTVWR